MASGTFNISTANQYISGYVAWSESNVDIVNNTSIITMTAYLHRTNTYSGTPTALNNRPLTRTFYINGETISWTENVSITIPNNGNYVEVASTSKTIRHDDDGKKDNMSIGFALSNSSGVTGFNVSATYSTASLDRILRVSVLNSVDINLNNNTITPYITKYSSSFYDVLVLYSGNSSFYINGVANGVSVALNQEQLNIIYNIIGTGENATLTCYLTTYSGSTSLGNSNTQPSVATLPNYSLTLTKSCVDNISTYNTYKNNSTDLIANLSQPRLTFSASSTSGSTYGRSIDYTVNGAAASSPAIYTNYTGGSFTIIASDGRKSTSWTSSNALIAYQKPTINCSVTRPSPTGTTANVTITGKYYNGTGLKTSALLNKVLRFVYKEHGGTERTITSFTYNETPDSNNMISFTATTTLTNLSYQKSVSYSATIIDRIGISADYIDNLEQGVPAWNAYLDSNYTNHFNVNGIYGRNGDCFFPIGYIYISVDGTNPSTFFGGTWERIQDRFLLAAGNTYAAGSTGGEASHTLTNAELPALSGSLTSYNSTDYAGATFAGSSGIVTLSDSANYVSRGSTAESSASYSKANISFGAGQAHNNMPPYLGVYMWKRIG